MTMTNIRSLALAAKTSAFLIVASRQYFLYNVILKAGTLEDMFSDWSVYHGNSHTETSSREKIIKR